MSVPTSRKLWATSVLVACAVACGGGKMPVPDYVQQPTSALVEVPYPPPPARAETMPKEPTKGARWIDGEWSWQGRRWAWKPGRWVVPPAGAKFSPWTTVRDKTGTLFFAPGVWRDAKGEEIDEPAAAGTGKAGAAAIVSPEGDPVPGGPNLPIDAGRANREDASALIEGFDASPTLLPDGGTVGAGTESAP